MRCFCHKTRRNHWQFAGEEAVLVRSRLGENKTLLPIVPELGDVGNLSFFNETIEAIILADNTLSVVKKVS